MERWRYRSRKLRSAFLARGAGDSFGTHQYSLRTSCSNASPRSRGGDRESRGRCRRSAPRRPSRSAPRCAVAITMARTRVTDAARSRRSAGTARPTPRYAPRCLCGMFDRPRRETRAPFPLRPGAARGPCEIEARGGTPRGGRACGSAGPLAPRANERAMLAIAASHVERRAASARQRARPVIELVSTEAFSWRLPSGGLPRSRPWWGT